MSEDQNGRKKLTQFQIIILIIMVLVIIGAGAFFVITSTQEDSSSTTYQTIDSSSSDEITTAVSSTSIDLSEDDVVATVNGSEVLGEEVLTSYTQLVAYYGDPDAEDEELYYSVAMEEAITLKLILITAEELGIDDFTDEELEELYATSDSEWEYALDNYVSYYYALDDDSTEEEIEEAYADAEAYYGSLGYSQESLRESYLENEIYERLQEELCKDVTVTDEEIQAAYEEAVAEDQDLYEDNIDAYENQMLMYQYGYVDEEPWYKPEGYRYIKHILIEVDEDLMDAYIDMLALYEEQIDDEVAAEDEEDADTDEEDADLITAEDIEAAEEEIIASVQDTIDEIYARLDEGEDFDDLMAEYGSDSGMTSGSYPDGYEVSLASYSYVTEFVAAAFSVDEIGDVSDPYISEYGVHIVLYAGDVPAGAVELTDELKDTIYESLYEDKCDELLDEWYYSADIEYTGVIRSVEEIEADEE